MTTSLPDPIGWASWLTINSAVRGPQNTLTSGTFTRKRRAAEITRFAQRDTSGLTGWQRVEVNPVRHQLSSVKPAEGHLEAVGSRRRDHAEAPLLSRVNRIPDGR